MDDFCLVGATIVAGFAWAILFLAVLDETLNESKWCALFFIPLVGLALMAIGVLVQ